MSNNRKIWLQRRRRVSEIVEAGTANDLASRAYDVFSTLMTLTNIAVTELYTFDKMEWNHGGTVLVPRGDLMLLEGDHIILYFQERISHASTIQV